MVIFTVIKFTIGLRASAEDELVGLDVSEHGMAAYPYIQSTEGIATI